MRLLAHTLAPIAALGLVALVSLSAQAAETPSVDGAKTRVLDALRTWEASVKTQNETRTGYVALERRINLLKKASTKRAFTGSSELDNLLKESVGADEALRADDRAVESSANTVKARVQEAIKIVDDKIKALKPALKQGTIDDQRKAALAINELIALRHELKQVSARVEEAVAVPREWSKYEVKVEPLDGPNELREKADFVEDQRDKFKKKRDELSRLIQEAKEEQTIAKAGAEFRTDARHFDEEARLGRVTRQQEKSTGGSASLANPTSIFDSSGSRAPSASTTQGKTASDTGTGGGMAGGAAPGTQSTGPADHGAPPPASPPTSNNPSPNPTPPQQPAARGTESDSFASNPSLTGSSVSSSDRATPNTTTSLGTSKTFDPAPIAKPLDPNVLLNLRVDALDGSTVDLKTLEAYAKDLDKLERFLAGRAVELRRKAAEMKASGKK